jgi:hypothetical protein
VVRSAETFVFASVASGAHVADYHAAQGDIIDVTALASQFHNAGLADGMLTRVVEDPGGSFAVLQVNTNSLGLKAGATWANVAQLDGVHSGDLVNALVDNAPGVHLAQLFA